MAPPLALSRSDLLNWINTNFQLNYQKIEQCGKGVVYCLLFDRLYPHSFNPAKIIKSPLNDSQVMQNYKLLQFGFNKRKLTRDVNVEKLIKCRLQDNLEFIQWFASQWIDLIGDIESNTSERVTSSSRRSSLKPSRNSSAGTSVDNSRSPPPPPPPPAPQKHQIITKQKLNSSISRSSIQQPSQRQQRISSSSNGNSTIIIGKLETEVKQLKSQLQDCKLEKENIQSEYKTLEHISDELNTERNFYLEKLRNIESISLDLKENIIELSNVQFVESILEVLYSTSEGFEVINENDYPLDNDGLIDNDNDSNGSVLETPKSDSLMGIIPNDFNHQQISHPTNILDDEETF